MKNKLSWLRDPGYSLCFSYQSSGHRIAAKLTKKLKDSTTAIALIGLKFIKTTKPLFTDQWPLMRIKNVVVHTQRFAN